MSVKSRLFFFLIVSLLFNRNALADEILGAWSSRDVPGVTAKDIEAATLLGVEEISRKNLTVDSWPETFLLMVGANQHKGDKSLLAALVSQIPNRAKAELKNTSRLIIWERITSGEILFEGMGYQISDDLFTVSGRANWMLRNLTGKNFGHVRPNTSEEELTTLHQKWSRWLNGEQVEEQQNQYALSGKESHELKKGITGPETLEALITSLKPHKGRDVRREKCLEIVRSLSGAPSAPTSAVAMEACESNIQVKAYLGFMTGIKNNHGYDWWKKWWEANKNQLLWNKEKGIFEVRK